MLSQLEQAQQEGARLAPRIRSGRCRISSRKGVRSALSLMTWLNWLAKALYCITTALRNSGSSAAFHISQAASSASIQCSSVPSL